MGGVTETKPSERVRKAAANALRMPIDAQQSLRAMLGPEGCEELITQVALAIDAFADEARAEALEEAAKVADIYGTEQGDEIAAAVRALKE